MYTHSVDGLTLNLALARAYSPTLGRWLNRDPLSESAGANLYAYAGNKPISYTDPLGLDVDLYSHDINEAPTEGHLNLRIYPDNPGDFPDLSDIMLKDQQGKSYFTLGAGPQRMDLFDLGNVVKGRNRQDDLDVSNREKHSGAKCNKIGPVAPPNVNGKPMSDTNFIRSLLNHFDNFNNNTSKYALTPVSGWNEYNSNGFIPGLVNSAGGTLPTFDSSRYPGFNQPVPQSRF